MKKVIVIGCPGSGKSVFSRALHRKTGLPLHHLDLMYWNADKTTVEKDVFLERLAAVLGQDAWIIDGNYASTMEQRITACDTVIFLDYPLATCLEGIRARQGKPRCDMPWVEQDEDTEFIAFVKSFRDVQRPKVLELLEKHSDKCCIVFTDRGQADVFLRDLRPDHGTGAFDRERLYALLTPLSRGRVVTYGKLAQWLGNKRWARAVGNALHANADGERYPCYKVVNSKGGLSHAYAFGGIEGQKRRLEAEGIAVEHDRVDLKKYGVD